MLCFALKPFFFLLLFFFLFLFIFSTSGLHFLRINQVPADAVENVGRRRFNEEVAVPWKTRRSEAEDDINVNRSMVLAKERTRRVVPTDNFHLYTGGWNISNDHYIASVFILLFPSFVIFGLCLSLICLCYCCCPTEPYGYSKLAYALSLIFLIIFTIAAIAGCAVLYTGQGKFHGSTSNTLNYVVNQAEFTARNLRNVSNYLDAAKQIGVDAKFLSSDVLKRIDDVKTKINTSAMELSRKTKDNSTYIHKGIDGISVVVGWILVGCTFVLCGVFLFLHNVTNINVPPSVAPLYYNNQSGPLIPFLCNPFNSDFTDRQCAPGEVTLDNATEVWMNYTCDQVSSLGNCRTHGRIAPLTYDIMRAAVNVGYGLYHYGPFLVDLVDCTFVRKTFTDISNHYCPGLRRYTQWIYVRLVIVSVAVMFCLIFWVIYGREKRHRVYTKQISVAI